MRNAHAPGQVHPWSSALYQGGMFKAVTDLPEWDEVEVAILGGQLDLFSHLNYRFNSETVPDEVAY